MIFPSDEVIETRRTLYARMQSGKISEEELFRRALEDDPDDIISFRFFAVQAKQQDDPQAERYARELIARHPLDHEGYLLLAQILSERDPQSPLANGYAQLAFEKMRDDEDALRNLDRVAKRLGLSEALKGVPRERVLSAFIEVLMRSAGVEPAAVTRELEPHRLIFRLGDSWDGPMEPEFVDLILQNGEACAPLLLGILKEWGHDLLTDDQQPLVERALALLGEIGYLAALPAMVEFLTLEDDKLFDPAHWAFRRAAWQHPEAALQKIREMLPAAGSAELLVLAHQLALMPEMPGRIDVIASLTAGIRKLGGEEQDALLMSVIAALLATEGRNSPLASSLERQYAGTLSRESLATLRDMRLEAPDRPFVPPPSDVTVYQVCCAEPDYGAPEEPSVEPIRRPPKPGRNDPCWCGSGKKYKKCHLGQDDDR